MKILVIGTGVNAANLVCKLILEENNNITVLNDGSNLSNFFSDSFIEGLGIKESIPIIVWNRKSYMPADENIRKFRVIECKGLEKFDMIYDYKEKREGVKERYKFCLDMREKYPEVPYIDPSIKIPDCVQIGKNVTIHEGCFLGTQGFGFEKDEEGVWLHIPHAGKLIIEDDVEIFEGCNICRGTVFETRIGKGTKIDVLCHIGHNSSIGKNCIITACCIVGGSSQIGDNVYLGLNTTVKDHVKITDGVFVGCGSNIIKDIIDPYTVWVGNPAKYLRDRIKDE